MGYCTGTTGAAPNLCGQSVTQAACESSYPFCSWVTTEGSGDVNLDGQVNALDVVGIVEHVLGTTPIQMEQALINADVNGDGFVDTADAILIIQNILGLNPTQRSTINTQLRQLSGTATTNRRRSSVPIRGSYKQGGRVNNKSRFGGRNQNNPKGNSKK